MTTTTPVGIAERAEDLHEALARDRKRYERLVYGRLRGMICWQDAEDIVSDALIRALGAADSDPPQPGNEQAWFARIVVNGGVDFLRSRDGRRRDGSRPRPDVVSLDELESVGVQPSGDVELAGGADAWIEALDVDADREQARALVARVLSRMPREDAELLRLRHLSAANATRDEVAARAGLTLGEFRWRHQRAWSRFVESVSAEQPSERCREIRALIGDADAAQPDDVARIDAHMLDCPSCRVFARDSYRVLELLPFLPSAGVGERWTARIASVWERFGPEAAGGGGAAGAGATGALGAGAAGTLKVAILCTTVVTAGVCGTTLLTHHPHRKAPDAGARAAAAKKTPRSRAHAAATVRRQPSMSTRSSSSSGRRTVALRPQSAIPASAPAGSQEFEPSGSGGRTAPAPAPATGGGEFGP